MIRAIAMVRDISINLTKSGREVKLAHYSATVTSPFIRG
jgi:hypothetical protein